MHESQEVDPLLDENAAHHLNLELLLDTRSKGHKNNSWTLSLRGVLMEYLGSEPSTIADFSSNWQERWDSCKNAKEYREVIKDLLELEKSSLNERRWRLRYFQNPKTDKTDSGTVAHKEYYLGDFDAYNALTNALPPEEMRKRKRTGSETEDDEADQAQTSSRKRWKVNIKTNSVWSVQDNNGGNPDVVDDLLRDQKDLDGDTAMLCEHVSTIQGDLLNPTAGSELLHIPEPNASTLSHQRCAYSCPTQQSNSTESNFQATKQNDFPHPYLDEAWILEQRGHLVNSLQDIYKLLRQAEILELRLKSLHVGDEHTGDLINSNPGSQVSATRNKKLERSWDEKALLQITEQIIQLASTTNFVASGLRLGNVERNNGFESTPSLESTSLAVEPNRKVKQQQGVAKWSIFEDGDHSVLQINNGSNTGNMQDENMDMA